MTTMSAACRITVDLPAMLGPVMTMSCASSGSSVVSLGTKRPAAASFSTTGWRPSSISRRSDVVDLGPHVAGDVRHLGQRGQRVEPRHQLGERQDAARALGHAAGAADRTPRARARRAARRRRGSWPRNRRARRDEALGVGQRLLAHVVGRHAIEVGARDLEVVAEHAVVADLERPDAGALALARLDLEDLALAALGQLRAARRARAEKPRRMKPPSRHCAGGSSASVRAISAATSRHSASSVDGSSSSSGCASRAAASPAERRVQERAHVGQPGQAARQRHQIARRRHAERGAPGEPLEIVDLGEQQRAARRARPRARRATRPRRGAGESAPRRAAAPPASAAAGARPSTVRVSSRTPNSAPSFLPPMSVTKSSRLARVASSSTRCSRRLVGHELRQRQRARRLRLGART